LGLPPSQLDVVEDLGFSRGGVYNCPSKPPNAPNFTSTYNTAAVISTKVIAPRLLLLNDIKPPFYLIANVISFAIRGANLPEFGTLFCTKHNSAIPSRELKNHLKL
jgi:hypothetical protein